MCLSLYLMINSSNIKCNILTPVIGFYSYKILGYCITQTGIQKNKDPYSKGNITHLSPSRQMI